MTQQPLATYKPGGFYYRKAYRECDTVDERTLIFDTLLADHEQLRHWVRQQGLIPPKFEVLSIEAEEKPSLFTSVFARTQLELGLPEPEQPVQAELLLFPRGEV